MESRGQAQIVIGYNSEQVHKFGKDSEAGKTADKQEVCQMCFLLTPERRGTLEANFDTNSHPGKVLSSWGCDSRSDALQD